MNVIVRLKKSPYWEEIDQKIKEGYSISCLAKELREKPEFSDLQIENIQRSLYKYRNKLKKADLLPALAANKRISESFLAKWQQIEKEFDELKELWKLYKLQRDRISIDYAHEKKINKLFATTHREVFTAAQLLKMIVGIKQDLGVIPKDLGRISIEGDVMPILQNVQVSQGVKVADVMQDSAKRQKILGLIDKISKISGFEDLIK